MPYILNTDKDRKEMLSAMGLSSLDELFAQIPEALRLKEPLNLEAGYSELKLKNYLKKLSKKNKTLDNFNSFLGSGFYDHYIPAALDFILSRSEFLTAYTPYQPECSQGILQAIYEYQTYICLLTGMDVSNASMLCGGSSLAEAVLMSLRLTKRKKVLVSSALDPQYLSILKTYLSGLDAVIEEVDLENVSQDLNSQVASCVSQSPNFFGVLENLKDISQTLKRNQSLSIAVVNTMSLAIVKSTGDLGVDIVCGDGQPLGGGLNFGGSGFGFLAAKKDYLRQLPGRIVGRTVDAGGNRAYCLTLQTREQHIRREKATSNICSNQSLNTIGAAVYLALMGRDGFHKTALNSFNNTQYLYRRLSQMRGVNIPFSPRVFNEFLWEVKESKKILKSLYKKGIIAGYPIGEICPAYENGILSSCTEKKTKAEIDSLINALAEILHG